MNKCKDCHWFNPTHATPNTSDECRKNAPIVWDRPNYSGVCNFPIVHKSDWCGDFKMPPVEADTPPPFQGNYG